MSQTYEPIVTGSLVNPKKTTTTMWQLSKSTPKKVRNGSAKGMIHCITSFAGEHWVSGLDK